MPVTTSLYNHSAAKFADQTFDLANLKVMLLDATPTFNGAHTQLSQVAGAANANEVSGNGWPAGGVTLANAAVSAVALNDATVNDSKLDGDDIVQAASGGLIGPAEAAVIYDDTDANDAPVAFIDFDGAQSAGDTTDFKITWNANGIVTWTNAA